jgi:hypothetical protein
MVKFLLGVIVSTYFFFFVWVGGTFVKSWRGLTIQEEDGSSGEVIQRKRQAWKGVKKKLTKEGEIQKKTQ